MIAQLLTTLIFIPMLGFIGCVLAPKQWERLIFWIAMSTLLLEGIVFLLLGYVWLTTDASFVTSSIGALYHDHHYTFSVDFYFDWLSAVFLSMATAMTSLVFMFSRPYLHREPGFKKFYCMVLLFFLGLAIIILGGNFEILLLGWEIIGISSVLLIAFYRDRYLPGRNSLKVFSVYRIADAFLLAAIWYAHHIFEGSVHFSGLSSMVIGHESQLTMLGFLLFVAALIKSAQFPFSYWLPRAMEGPTSSSAIFYGALSVHMGLFLLLRTYPLWQGSVSLRITIGVVGLVTAIVAASITRVQSTIKTQIAYASITQIGIMFIEVALGLPWLAVLHFVSNASLRTYQLLISPSIVGYLVHDQFFSFVPPPQSIKNTLLGKIHATIYVLSIKEWDMNTTMSQNLWQPLKSIGRLFSFLDQASVQIGAVALFLACWVIALSVMGSEVIAILAAILSIIFYIRAYTTKNSAIICWNLLMLAHLWGTLFLGLAVSESRQYLILYILGFSMAFIIGHACLWYLQKKGESLILKDYQGSIYTFHTLGNIFFIVCLLFMTFPVSPSFLGQDILLTLIPVNHFWQIALFCIAYILMGISIMRLYTKLFFGPHKLTISETAYKSS